MHYQKSEDDMPNDCFNVVSLYCMYLSIITIKPELFYENVFLNNSFSLISFSLNSHIIYNLQMCQLL